MQPERSGRKTTAINRIGSNGWAGSVSAASGPGLRKDDRIAPSAEGQAGKPFTPSAAIMENATAPRLAVEHPGSAGSKDRT